VGLKLRQPARADAPALGGLLLDAYRATVDDEGEDLGAAIAEAEGYFAGTHGRAMPGASVVAWRGEVPVAGCLVGWWAARDCPFIVFVAVRTDSKGAGVGRLVLGESVRRLGRAGHKEVRAVVTQGNAASQALFKSRGFEDLGATAPR
jgi:ribosomal protein S18 acetylase RimI-like enzyme